MKIAVLGAICFDEIFPVEGERRESFGGILYNAAALLSVLDDGDSVVPVSNVGEDRYDAVLKEFSKLPHVETRGLNKCPGRLMHVILRWKTVSHREESARNPVTPLAESALAAVADCDAAHLNFIYGTEVRIETLRALRRVFGGLLSMDVHNIISQFDDDGKRTIVGFKQWREWAPYLDIVQCNEMEIRTMFDRKLETRAEFALAAKEVCQAGPRAVSVTLGPEGAVMVHRKGADFYLVDIDVLPPIKAVDTTGCGDSFSAGFIVGMLRYDDPATALACASVVAGVNARYTGIGRLAEAKGYLDDPRRQFAVYEGKPSDWSGVPI